MHVRDAVLPVDDELTALVGRTTQGAVQDGTVLGGVDMRAREHEVAALLQMDRPAQGGKQTDGLVRHEVLGQVEVEVRQVEGELPDALGIVGELLLEAETTGAELVEVLPQRLPLGGLRGVNRCGDGGGIVCHVCSLVAMWPPFASGAYVHHHLTPPHGCCSSAQGEAAARGIDLVGLAQGCKPLEV